MNKGHLLYKERLLVTVNKHVESKKMNSCSRLELYEKLYLICQVTVKETF